MKKYMTVVFEITDEDLNSKRNPFHIDVPGLKVVGVSTSDLMHKIEELQKTIAELSL